MEPCSTTLPPLRFRAAVRVHADMIASIPSLPLCLAYSPSEAEALLKAPSRAFRGPETSQHL